jgi:hypothetical protein
MSVIIYFPNLPNPSGRTMALAFTRLLTETCTWNLPAGKARRARKADNLTAICEFIMAASDPVSSKLCIPIHLKQWTMCTMK